MYKKRYTLVVLTLFTMVVFSSCNVGISVVKGSGNLVTETRQVSNFDSIILNGSGEVIITQGQGESLSIETDDNVIDHVEAVVKGGTLRLSLVSGNQVGVNIQSYSRLVFYVGVENLESLSISGSGKIKSEKLNADSLQIMISGSGTVQISGLSASVVRNEIGGSGRIELSGEVDRQDVKIDGSGKYLSGDLCSASVEVSVSGSGNATVCATETLDANVSGSGSINYYGDPAVTSSKSGSGSINSLGGK